MWLEVKTMQEVLMSLLQLVLLLFNPVILTLAIIIIIVLIKKNKEYKNGAYYQITQHPYFLVKHNTGRYGEYLTYKYLKQFETNGAKFLFNIYIPKENGETTEIDVLMICKKGLFVFESKNYSGWIFGSENQKNWCQTLPTGRGRSHKELFYNPIMQNRSHIKYLKVFLGEQFPMRSIIVFSDRCTLKNVQIRSNDISVINRYTVAPVVSAICNQIPNDLLTDNDITEIYNKLYPYTQVDEYAKMQHVANIHNKLNPQLIQQVAETSVQVISQTETEPVIEQPDTVVTNTITATEEKTIIENIESITTDATEQQVLKCPKCNGDLILRTATRGANAGRQFYGCSNYPKCKYIQNIMEGKMS